jgi:hypothetical protein
MQMRSADMKLVVNDDLADDEKIELSGGDDADEIAGPKGPKRVMMTVKARAQALAEANRRRNGMWLCVRSLGPASLICSAEVWREADGGRIRCVVIGCAHRSPPPPYAHSGSVIITQMLKASSSATRASFFSSLSNTLILSYEILQFSNASAFDDRSYAPGGCSLSGSSHHRSCCLHLRQ